MQGQSVGLVLKSPQGREAHSMYATVFTDLRQAFCQNVHKIPILKMCRRRLHSTNRPTEISTELTQLTCLPDSCLEKCINVIKWRAWARREAELELKTQARHVDNPSLENLLTELDWLLEDNIAAHIDAGTSTLSSCSKLSSDCMNSSWFRYGRNIDGSSLVSLRLPLEQLSILWKRRLVERVPLQYLTYTAHWRDLVLFVSPAVLIPRAETELLVELAMHAYEKYQRSDEDEEMRALKHGPWLELGSGSGAISVALAKDLKFEPNPNSPRLYAVEVSPSACSVAKRNFTRYGLNDTVKLVHGSWFDAFNDSENMKHLRFAGIISNPPYIPSHEISLLQPEVQHEPVLALDGGVANGTDCLRAICQGAAQYLLRGGILILETHGDEQTTFLSKELASFRHFEKVEIHHDYANIQRFVTARRI